MSRDQTRVEKVERERLTLHVPETVKYGISNLMLIGARLSISSDTTIIETSVKNFRTKHVQRAGDASTHHLERKATRNGPA